jgi:hypothetical protein
VSTVFIVVIGVAIVVLRDVIRERSDRDRFARIEAGLERALQASPDVSTGSPYRDTPAGSSSVPATSFLPEPGETSQRIPIDREPCSSMKYGTRCLGLGDPRCVAGNCTEHCNEHCKERCRKSRRSANS